MMMLNKLTKELEKAFEVKVINEEGKLISKELKKNPHRNLNLPYSEGAV